MRFLTCGGKVFVLGGVNLPGAGGVNLLVTGGVKVLVIYNQPFLCIQVRPDIFHFQRRRRETQRISYQILHTCQKCRAR